MGAPSARDPASRSAFWLFHAGGCPLAAGAGGCSRRSLAARRFAFGAWLSTVIILCGLAFYLNQKYRAEAAYDFPPAYQVAAQSIIP